MAIELFIIFVGLGLVILDIIRRFWELKKMESKSVTVRMPVDIIRMINQCEGDTFTERLLYVVKEYFRLINEHAAD